MKRIFCYLLYYFFAKHLPRSYELGPFGKWSSRLRRILCRPLFKNVEGFFSVERGADFGGGKNIIIREYGSLGENARVMGEGTVTIGRHGGARRRIVHRGQQRARARSVGAAFDRERALGRCARAGGERQQHPWQAGEQALEQRAAAVHRVRLHAVGEPALVRLAKPAAPVLLALGAAELPLNMCIELELILQVR